MRNMATMSILIKKRGCDLAIVEFQRFLGLHIHALMANLLTKRKFSVNYIFRGEKICLSFNVLTVLYFLLKHPFVFISHGGLCCRMSATEVFIKIRTDTSHSRVYSEERILDDWAKQKQHNFDAQYGQVLSCSKNASLQTCTWELNPGMRNKILGKTSAK